MIYIGKARPAIMDEGKAIDIIDFFASYQPKKVCLPVSEDNQKKLKLQLDGFISGEIRALIRKNENVLTRDCLIFDLDDVIVSEEELKQRIAEKFDAFDYVLYPSLSNQAKGVRYRLLLPLDASVNESDYKLLIRFFSHKVLHQIIGKPDDSNATWSQLMLLPVSTQHSEAHILVSRGEKRISTESAIKGATAWQNEQEPRKQRRYDTTRYKRGANRIRNTTTELFESLVAGCPEGNRNNRIAQITGGLLARAVDVRAVYQLVLFANEHFEKPLPAKEVEATFYSIAKKELSC